MSHQKAEITYRPLREAEVSEARSLILAGLEEHFGYLDLTLNPDLDDIKSNYLDRGHPFIVAEKHGVIVGTGALVEIDAKNAQIVRVSVAKNQRRQGIARAIVKRLIQEAQQRGYVKLWVETGKDWQDAVGLYLSCGFKRHREDDTDVYFVMELGELPS